MGLEGSCPVCGIGEVTLTSAGTRCGRCGTLFCERCGGWIKCFCGAPSVVERCTCEKEVKVRSESYCDNCESDPCRCKEVVITNSNRTTMEIANHIPILMSGSAVIIDCALDLLRLIKVGEESGPGALALYQLEMVARCLREQAEAVKK